MRRLISLLGSLAIVLAVSASASAGYWEIVYDLAPNGSQLTTNTPFGAITDPITGTFTIQYDAVHKYGPISGARLVAGHPHTNFNQNYGGILTITGFTDTTLLPPGTGTPGTITEPDLNFSVVADSNVTGFNHCTDPTSGAGCGLAGFTISVNNPLTPATSPNPWPVPKLQFASTVGKGDFTSTTKTATGGGATLSWVFKGKEISRVWNGPAVPALSDGGRVGLGLCLLLGATWAFAFRRGRTT